MSEAPLARDREAAYGLYPEEMEALDDKLHRLRTSFRDAFYYLRLPEASHLIPFGSGSKEFLLLQRVGESKVALHLWCDDVTEQVSELGVIDPTVKPFVQVIHEQQTTTPQQCDCQHERAPQREHQTGAARKSSRSRTPAGDAGWTPYIYDDSCYWSFGYDFTRPGR